MQLQRPQESCPASKKKDLLVAPPHSEVGSRENWAEDGPGFGGEG